MAILTFVGMDPSMSNWGLSRLTFNTETLNLALDSIAVVQPRPDKSKQVRRNSKDLQISHELSHRVTQWVKGCHAMFVEVPVGSQSARAMASYGICIGILGTLRAHGVPFFELTPTEIKLVATGSKTASKQDMISWAESTYPSPLWPTQNRGGVPHIVESKAEHIADSIAAIHAGIQNPEFQRLLQFITLKETA
jgi:Holliday junction resolvasome RuvABC endonuclease subunit